MSSQKWRHFLKKWSQRHNDDVIIAKAFCLENFGELQLACQIW